MTDYISNFVLVESSEAGQVLDWRGYTIYWNPVTEWGQVHAPDGEYIAMLNNLERLAYWAARHYEERQS